MTAATLSPPAAEATIHPSWVRVTHWINAIAILVMIGSGWQIYDASPLFGFTFPQRIALGNWLGGALLWHFAAMWLLVINAIVYVTLGIVTGRFRRKLLPIYPSQVLADIKAALAFRLSHDDLVALQRGAEAALCRHHPDRRGDRGVRPVDLEAGAVAGIDRAVWRLRHCPLRAFRCHGGDRRLPGGACFAGAARAEEPARHGHGKRTTPCASAKSFPASMPSCWSRTRPS